MTQYVTMDGTSKTKLFFPMLAYEPFSPTFILHIKMKESTQTKRRTQTHNESICAIHKTNINIITY